MLKRRRAAEADGLGVAAVAPAWWRKRAKLSEHLPYGLMIADDLIETRSGDVFGMVSVDGVDDTVSEESAVASVTRAIDGFINGLEPGAFLYAHRISDPARIFEEAAHNDFASILGETWADDLMRRGLWRRRWFFTVGTRAGVIGGGDTATMAARVRENLKGLVGALGNTGAGGGARIATDSDGELLGCCAALMGTGFATRSKGVQLDDDLASEIALSSVAFKGGLIGVGRDEEYGERLGEIYSLKTYGGRSRPGMFADFDGGFSTVVTHSFDVLPRQGTAERISTIQRRLSAADSAAISWGPALADAADKLESGDLVFGKHHMTVAVYADSMDELERAGAAVREAAAASGTALVREKIGARAAWFAQHPGNFDYRARSAVVSSRNFADFACPIGRAKGRGADGTPWAAPIATIPHATGEGYRFNFHEAGGFGPEAAPSEPTSGMSLVVGRPGSGKTTTIAFMMAMARRIGARVIVFDKDHGLEMAVRALGGRYRTIRQGEAPGFNPFETEIDAQGQAWLTEWLAMLMEGAGELTPAQSDYLAEAVRENADNDLRNISAFRSLFSALDDGDAPDGRLYDRLGEWDADGRFGWVLGGADSHDFDMGHDVMAFDMSEILERRREKAAILGYIMLRIDRLKEDGRPTLLICDEAWSLFEDPFFARKFEGWAVTFRKKNVAIVAMSQLMSHFAQTSAGKKLAEIAVTKIIFPNDASRPEDYDLIGLNGQQSALASMGGHVGRIAVVASGDDAAVLNVDLSGLGPLLTVLGGGRAGEARFGADWRERPDFWRDAI